MKATNKKFKGVILLIVGIIALIYGMYYLSETTQTNLEISSDRLIFLILAFALSGVAFYFAAKFFKVM